MSIADVKEHFRRAGREQDCDELAVYSGAQDWIDVCKGWNARPEPEEGSQH